MTVETTEKIPLPWLKGISRELFALDDSPMLGFPPAFPWQKFSQDFARCFGVEQCEITPLELKWREKEALLEGMPAPRIYTEIGASGIEKSAQAVMNEKDLQQLLQIILGVPNEVIDLQSEMLSAFYHFLNLQCVQLVNSIDFDKRLSFRIISFDEMADPSSSLCLDVRVTIGKDAFVVRLIIPEPFRTSWKNFNLRTKPTLPTADRLAETLVTLHVEAGRTGIGLQELLQIKPGDFLFLDHPFYNQDAATSRLHVTLDSKPIFRTSLKDGKLTIDEISLHDEVYDSMIDKVNPSFAPSNVNPPGYVPQQEPQKPQEPHEDEENPFEEEEEEEEVDVEQVKEQAAKMQLSTAAPKEKAEKPAVSTPLTPNDIPLTLVVEVGQVKITAQKLLELSPGNVIELGRTPEDGVDLVINGRIIGKGELLKIGDSLGVRIVQIGVST